MVMILILVMSYVRVCVCLVGDYARIGACAVVTKPVGEVSLSY